MPTDAAGEPGGQRKKARRPDRPSPPINLNPPPSQPSPTARLDAMTRERIDSLEADRVRLREELDRLRSELDRLAPANARLNEALANAETNNLVSTILIVLGGGIISYATFTGNVGQRVADAGGGILLAGILLLIVVSLRRRLTG